MAVPTGELGASLRYLSQRFSMPTEMTKATLNDIGTEELGHLEMIGTMVNQLTRGVSPENLRRAGLGDYYTDHGLSVYPQNAGGVPFTASYIGVKGDPVTDLYEDMAAEQKARTTYEYLIDLSDDPDVTDILKFLREREVVHFQRFGETLRAVQEKLAQKKFYMNNGMQSFGNQTNSMPTPNCGCKNAVTDNNIAYQNMQITPECGCQNNN